MKRLLLVFLVVGLAGALLAACYPPEGLSTTISVLATDPVCDGGHCFLNNSGGGPDPAIENGAVNSCIDTVSNVAGRFHYCRVVDGYDDGHSSNPVLRDNRNFLISIDHGDVEALHDSANGAAIVLYSGQAFEGCEVIMRYPFVPGYYGGKPYSKYLCEYRIRKPIVTRTSGSNAWDYVLRKSWHWTLYVGNDVGCAGGMAGVMAGVGHITFPLLTDCVDGPM